jgi:hypothetical protein
MDSDDEKEKEKNPCKIVNNTIYSNYSPNNKLKYYPSSFSFTFENNILIIQFNPMFFWRLIQYQKNNNNKFKTTISKHLANQFIIYVHPTYVFYNNAQQDIDNELYDETKSIYYRLFNAIKRNYDTQTILDEMLQKGVDILMCIES